MAADPRAASVPTREAQLSKAALLYGDRVTVLSPVTAMLLRASELSRVGVKRQVEVLHTIAPLLASGSKTAELQRGLALTAASLGKVPLARNSTDLIMRQTLLENLGSTINILTTIAEHNLQERGVGEFTPVRARGLLAFESGASGNDLKLLGACLGQTVLAGEGLRLDESHETRLLDAFAARLSRHVASGRDWLLLDESVASLVTSGWRESSALWGWLPTFPQATLDELLLIRSRLGEPIQRLHRALGSILESLSDQHSGPVPNELHDAPRETVGPAIEAIATAAREDHELRRISARIPGTTGDPWLGLALIGPAAAGYGPAAWLAGDEPGAATAALEAAWQRRLPDHEVRLPPFFLAYRSSDSVPNVSDQAHRAVAAR